MRWFADEFGTTLLDREIVLPTAKFLCEKDYSASFRQIEKLVARICELMLVDPGRVKLELFDGTEGKKEAAKHERSYAVGHFRMDDGQAIIALDQTEARDRNVLTAITAHELCHLRLLGEDRIRPDRPDGERLTDLLTVYSGFGIFSTNAAFRFARAARNWSVLPWGELDDQTLNAARRNDSYHRLGYLTSPEFGYALSCYSWLHHDTRPRWASFVNPGPRINLEQGLAYLAVTSPDGGEFPTQRILNRTVNIRGATVRVMRANKWGGPGRPAGLLPDPATARSTEDNATADPTAGADGSDSRM
jgi:hypothetical protein